MISGFSKLSKEQKIELLTREVALSKEEVSMLKNFQYDDTSSQAIFDDLSENTISNYTLPFSIAPNFLINQKRYFVPMVTEESSVVAAAGFAAKFWSARGGFNSTVISTKKQGQIYFSWDGDIETIRHNFNSLKDNLLKVTEQLTKNMVTRGGGIKNIRLANKAFDKNIFEIKVDFDTVDSMGANFINSCLEIIANELKAFIINKFPETSDTFEVIMAILSNYTPECLVDTTVSCDIKQLVEISGGMSPTDFAHKFEKAVRIAENDTSRAVTHNKGIFNGIDAVLIATGNDFRAVEAGAHAYAASEGSYKSLTTISLDNNRFTYSLKVPVAVGTVGGITSLHPMAKLALRILGNPTAKELMGIVASAGLANNFAAIRSLITEGIQKGHMKLHLNNILHYCNASEEEKLHAGQYFNNRTVSYQAVKGFIENLRSA